MVGTSDSSRAVSASGEYKLDDTTFLNSEITLGEGVVYRQSSAGGSGKNEISEASSGSGKSIRNTVTSEGSFNSKSSDAVFSEGAISDHKASLAGSSGSINTVSTGEENCFMVAGGFSGEGKMDFSLTSMAGQEALTTGSASAMGTSVFSDELARGIRGQDMAVSVQGLYQAGEKGLGEFGMVAQNVKPGGAAAKPTPTPVDYKLSGWMWQERTPSVFQNPIS